MCQLHKDFAPLPNLICVGAQNVRGKFEIYNNSKQMSLTTHISKAYCHSMGR